MIWLRKQYVNATTLTVGGANPWLIRGPQLWAELHAAALAKSITPEYLAAFRARLTCGECKRHFDEWLAANPLGADQFAWSVALHNAVNARLGKLVMGMEAARQALSNE